ncbi:uncharacterized protein BJ212DRAFT_1488057 [Suillus subaureus]|uniref:Uncharacterized protein n=1 Tax=Suillus subaureus TaxID=48587 RepID=A0A9P7DPP3_9AGAM|nr:uncharacterized protein BJ212DRAFT_1488057 [Suillus subaureus]KAG1800112.1 hypothetical protein BJ212DRAFT_1488057 [Suillus subaureus]
MDMEEAQTQVQKNKLKAVKPRPQPVGKKKGQGVVSKEGRPDIDSGNTGAAGISSKAAVLGEDVDEDFLPSDNNEDTLDIQKRRKGWKMTPHQSLKAAINNACKKTMLESGIADDDRYQACAQTNKKGNSLP